MGIGAKNPKDSEAECSRMFMFLHRILYSSSIYVNSAGPGLWFEQILATPKSISSSHHKEVSVPVGFIWHKLVMQLDFPLCP